MIKNEFEKFEKMWNMLLSQEPYDYLEQKEVFNLLAKDYSQTYDFLSHATIDEIELSSEVLKELICFYKSQELLNIFKKFIGSEFKYICTDSYDEDVEDAQYILDNHIEIPVPNPA
ncbi:MAG: hypothetical protein RR416_06030, partial [Clostridia bacterium]